MTDVAIYYLPTSTESAPVQRARQTPVSDVRFFHGEDGGDIELVGGLVTMSDGLEAAVYLSLWGGNEDDSGSPADRLKQWWGNFGETDPARMYRSETQWCVANLPPTSSNLRRLEEAAKNDLAWLVTAGVARAVSADATMPARNHVKLSTKVEVLSGKTYPFVFPRSWGDRTT